MERPGFLNGFRGLAPKYRPASFAGFGAFGKGVVAPPPPPKPAVFKNGQWACDEAKPASDASHYYHCCPAGWTKVTYGDTQPCKGHDDDLSVCGPLPAGATEADAVCCRNQKEWAPTDPSGADPCAPVVPAGQAIPGRPETILAPDIIVPQDQGSSGSIFVVLGIGFVLLTGITLFVKMRG